MNNNVPKFAVLLLKLFMRKGLLAQRLNDFSEIHELLEKHEGIKAANRWYWEETIKSIPTLIYDSFYWGTAMFKNYLITAFRNIKKSKVYSFINIFGLAIGMTCTILILAYVTDELDYDTYHKNADRVYRLTNRNGLAMSGLLGPMIKEDNAKVEDFTRIYASKIYTGDILISHEDEGFYIKDFAMADPSIFKLFTFDFIRGSAETALSNNESIVITEEIAEKFFGDVNPVGKVLVYENQYNFTVTGVIKNIPRKSHFKYDCIIPLKNYEIINAAPGELESFKNWAFVTYLLFTPDADMTEMKNQINNIITERSHGEVATDTKLQLLTDIHLKSNLLDELKVNGSIASVYVFIAIAILVLLIASVNFINLSTARSSKRAKEVGVRKAIGANRKMLIYQFLSESIMMSFNALVFALILVSLLLPYFNNISGKQLDFAVFTSPSLLIIYFIGTLLIGLMAGSFPAFVISSYKPCAVLKTSIKSKKENRYSFRNILVVVQFTIAIALIICTTIIYNQMNYMQEAELGLDKNKMVVIPIGKGESVIEKVDLLKRQLGTIDAVQYATASSRTPGHRPWGRGIKKLDEVNPDYENLTVYTLWVDYNFTETYNIELAVGRSFSKEYGTDESSAFIINETTSRALGWNNPNEAIGNHIESDGKKGEIIGVAKDFHFLSLHTQIAPMIMHIKPVRFYTVSAKINSTVSASALLSIEKVWNNIFPNRPFEYFFLEDDLSQQYKADHNVGVLITYCSILSLFITCLGLIGLASYSAEQKKKEIGIRKVLGASTNNILLLLVKRFIGLTMLGNIVAWPVAYYAMDKWLMNFAYRTEITILPFLIAALFALIIAVAAVGYQSAKAAFANPINSIKYE